MIFKLLVAVAVAYLGWRLWQGFSRLLPGTPKRAIARSPDDRAARQVLGVAPEATAEDIRAAHRRLIAAVHPDRGGSLELTRQINAARDLLLRRVDG
jgi:hypothetical protein